MSGRPVTMRPSLLKEPPRAAPTSEVRARPSQLPTRPSILLEECIAALHAAGAANEPDVAALGIPRAPSVPTLVSSDDVPYMLLSRAELEWFTLDEQAVRVVLRIDGRTNVDAIARAASLAFHEVARVLGRLVDDGIVAFQ